MYESSQIPLEECLVAAVVGPIFMQSDQMRGVRRNIHAAGIVGGANSSNGGVSTMDLNDGEIFEDSKEEDLVESKVILLDELRVEMIRSGKFSQLLILVNPSSLSAVDTEIHAVPLCGKHKLFERHCQLVWGMCHEDYIT